MTYRPPPDERQAITHNFTIEGREFYITVGMYNDDAPAEIFLTTAKEGSVVAGLMDAFASAVSIALQHGVPLKTLVQHFDNMRFEPSGPTRNPEIPYAKSPIDYAFRWLANRFPEKEKKIEEPRVNNEFSPTEENVVGPYWGDAPACKDCGSAMVSEGPGYRCLNCGSTMGIRPADTP